MRVIAGSARRILLKTPDGLGTRPTTDRIKETLFNMLQPRLYDSRFLDLFSGSGGIGIEALSRGARHTEFVENNPEALSCIRENLTRTALMEKAGICGKDVMAALKDLDEKGQSYTIIFMDPPYDHHWEEKILDSLSHSQLLASDCTIIVEASLETSFDYADSMGYIIVKRKTYKTNQHVFLRKKEN